MSVFLFDDIIFGPVRSRRLGLSLGINLLPAGRKVCSFDCIYCECGWTHHDGSSGSFPPADEVCRALRTRLGRMRDRDQAPDAITFAGNGEPTLHPEFPGIMDAVLSIRDELFPAARVCVLSNATRLRHPGVSGALARADLNMLKLDAGTEKTFRNMNQAKVRTDLATIIEDISAFNGNYVIQSMFVQGESGGIDINNSSDEEVASWLEHIRMLRPERVMIYSLDRGTPIPGLRAVSRERLDEIACRVKEFTGFRTEVY